MESLCSQINFENGVTFFETQFAARKRRKQAADSPWVAFTSTCDLLPFLRKGQYTGTIRFQLAKVLMHCNKRVILSRGRVSAFLKRKIHCELLIGITNKNSYYNINCLSEVLGH